MDWHENQFHMEGAHAKFFRGLDNPVGVKLSKEIASTEENLRSVVQLIKMLNPSNIEGQSLLIPWNRLGDHA